MENIKRTHCAPRGQSVPRAARGRHWAQLLRRHEKRFSASCSFCRRCTFCGSFRTALFSKLLKQRTSDEHPGPGSIVLRAGAVPHTAVGRRVLEQLPCLGGIRVLTVFPSLAVALLLAALCRGRMPGGRLIKFCFPCRWPYRPLVSPWCS